MGKSSYRTVPCNQRWAVQKDGSARALSVHESQATAWNETQRLASGARGEAELRDRDGKIRTRNAYGRDPAPPQD